MAPSLSNSLGVMTLTSKAVCFPYLFPSKFSTFDKAWAPNTAPFPHRKLGQTHAWKVPFSSTKSEEEDASSPRQELTLLLFLSKALAVLKDWVLLTLRLHLVNFHSLKLLVLTNFVQFYTFFLFFFFICKENLPTPLCCHHQNSLGFLVVVLMVCRCDSNIVVTILKSFNQHEIYTKIFMVKLYNVNIYFKIICVLNSRWRYRWNKTGCEIMSVEAW